MTSPVPGLTDIEKFRQEGHKMIDYIADYYTSLVNGKTPNVRSTIKPNDIINTLPKQAPEHGDPNFDNILSDITNYVMPGITHWQHPNFFAFFQCIPSYPALVGNMLADAFNQPGFNWMCSPAASELEVVVTDWVTRAMQMPSSWLWSSGVGGCVLQPSATEAVMMAMIAAKRKALVVGVSGTGTTTQESLSCYFSEQAHFCVEKAARVLSVQHVRKIKVKWSEDQQNFPMDVEELQRMIEDDKARGLKPFFVSASFGTTGTTACDDLTAIGNVARANQMFYNIDGACCGAVGIVPELREMLRGVETADTFICNGSKWFPISTNTTFMFFADRRDLVPCFNATGVYLDNEHTSQNTVIDFKDYHVGLARPFRSLKVFVALKEMGLEGVRTHIRRMRSLAALADEKMRESKVFEIVTRTRFTLVTFRVATTTASPSSSSESLQKAFLDLATKENWMFLVNTVVMGKTILRLSLNSPHLDESRVLEVVARMVEYAQKVIIASQ
eukprot:PhF_6_TR15026/c0_g1_i1/m.23567/K01593/DDC; aromatic-L-amino-acid decarboxylase